MDLECVGHYIFSVNITFCCFIFYLTMHECTCSMYEQYIFNCRYYNTEVCPKGPLCAYRHKKRFEVDAVAFLRGADFFLGELPVPRTRRAVCHFYKLGKCLYQNNCRFLHDNDNSLEGDKTEEKER